MNQPSRKVWEAAEAVGIYEPPTAVSTGDGRVAAFRTLRDGKVRTVGFVVVLPESHRPPGPELALAVAEALSTPFEGPCAAYGKIVFLNVRDGRVQVFQVEGDQGERVFCGNANVAAAAIAALIRGERELALLATDGIATVCLETTVQSFGAKWYVESAWRITPHLDEYSVSWDANQHPVARIDALNDYEFSVGSKLDNAARFESCRRKACRITPGMIPEVQVSTCGRIHGALPQTGAISLQLARAVFPFILEAVPSEIVSHPSGLEKLPSCHWEDKDYVAVMPGTSVEFAKPISKASA